MKAFLAGYDRVLKVLLTWLIGLMVIPVSLQILSRYTRVIPRYIWTEEVARFCFVWIIMIGSIIAVREGTHFNVDLWPQPSAGRRQACLNLLVHVAMLFMAIVFIYYGFGFARFGFLQTSEMSGINMLSIYISFPLAGASWTLFLLERIVAEIRLMVNDKPRDAS